MKSTTMTPSNPDDKEINPLYDNQGNFSLMINCSESIRAVGSENLHCSEEWSNILVKYSFATEGVGLCSVAFVGIIANTISIAVLAQRTMKTQISALLITLAIFDILFLFCTFPVFTVQSANNFVLYLNTCAYPNDPPMEFLSPWMTKIYNIFLPFLYGLTHVSKVGSVFTTLAVSLERYFAVCKPLWIRIRRCHPAMYIVTVTLFAFGFNIPKFMEFESFEQDNQTQVRATSLRTNEAYIVYYNFWTKTFLTELFPYVCLIFFNACIYREIRRSVKIQQSMRCTQSQKEEIKSANVVVGVVLLSILCHIWKIVPDLYEAITKLRRDGQDKNNTDGLKDPCNIENTDWNINIEFIIDTSHLLVGINSAANFFIYCLLRKNFRAATWRLLTCTKAPPSAHPHHSRHPTVITTASRVNSSSRRSKNGESRLCVRSPGSLGGRNRSASTAGGPFGIEDVDENTSLGIEEIALVDRTNQPHPTLRNNHYHHSVHLSPHPSVNHHTRMGRNHATSSLRANKNEQQE